jgi:hypothetical protein
MMSLRPLLPTEENMPEKEVLTAEEILAKGKTHDQERIQLDWYYAPLVAEWVSLNYWAGLISRDDSLRGYGYYQTNDDEVIFYSEASPSYANDRGDYESYDESYLSIPVSFITGVNDTDRARLAEMIEAREKEQAKAMEERKAARTLSN